MKRLRSIVIPCITIVTLAALYLASGAGASAAILPQRLRNTTCGAWGVVASPNVGTTNNTLSGIAALSTNNVWAVGSTSGSSGIQTLVEHWNGSAWSVVQSSGPASVINTLNGVAAISANNVWAAGDDTNSPAPSAEYAPLIEQWNGSSWSIVNSPTAGTADFVNGIAALSASNIWVVGDYRTSLDPSGPYFTLIEHWNGTKWSVVKSPSPGSMASDLQAAARVPATNKVWAVGFTIDNNNVYHTLTESHC